MTELFSLVKNLGKEESIEVRRSLKESGNQNLLLGKLFSYITTNSNEKLTDKELSIALYKRSKHSALPSIKSRLFLFILETTVSNKLMSSSELYDINDKKMLRVRKKMLQFRALYRKKNRPDIGILFHLLNEIISEAKEAEQYDVLIDALIFKKSILKIRKGFSEVKKIEVEQQHYQYTYSSLLKVNDYYIDLITNQDQIKEKGEQSIIKNLRLAVSEINKFIAVTKSPTINYYHNLLQLELQIKTNKFEKALTICTDIKKLLEKNQVLYRSERMGFVLDNICEIQVYKHSFKEAIKSAKEAQKFYSSNSLSFLLSKQQEFIANFYAGNYAQSIFIIDEMLKFPLLNKGEFRHDKYLFFKACTNFKLGEFKDALKICNLALKLNKDKGRWDMGIRYLRLMCLIERKDDKAFDSTEALRKNAERMHSQKLLSKRDELIYKLFNIYAHNSFGLKPNSKLLNILEKFSLPENKWTFYSHEPIPIDNWIKNRLHF